MEVAGEMKIDLIHRNHLRVPAASRTAFDPEDRPERGLPDADHDPLAETADTSQLMVNLM